MPQFTIKSHTFNTSPKVGPLAGVPLLVTYNVDEGYTDQMAQADIADKHKRLVGEAVRHLDEPLADVARRERKIAFDASKFHARGSAISLTDEQAIDFLLATKSPEEIAEMLASRTNVETVPAPSEATE